MPLPRLRSLVKIVPFKHEGREVFLASDAQEGLFDHQLLLPPLGFVVAALLDGKREAADVRTEIAAQIKGADVGLDEIEAVVRQLDEHLLLENGRSEECRRRVVDEYQALPSRPARFCRGAAAEVLARMDGYFTASAGAGKPGAREPDSLRAIMAPHIDFDRGGNCYTYAYREIAERSDADLYIILGVAHLSPSNPFVVSSKSYETPLGAVETDREVVAALERRLGRRIFEFEWLHRTEHSAEFQAVFLRHARPEAKFTAVPILCSSFEGHCGSASPSTAPILEDFLGALREAVKGRKVCFVAGVDFAHVGPVFGDEIELDPKTVRWMVDADSRSLQACGEGSAEGFWNSVMSDGNKRHVCGLSATYATLRLLDGAPGKLLKYGFAPDPQGGLVSFASMSFR